VKWDISFSAFGISLVISAVSPGPTYMAMNYSKLLMKAEIIISSHERRTSTVLKYTECFKKSFTTLREYTNLYRGHTQRFELS
jgi:hypothetical protein